MSLSIIIPARNEEGRIGATLKDYANTFPDGTILVVDNGSIDGTVSTVRKLQKEYSNIKLLSYQKPLGKGGAVYEGFKNVKTDFVGFVDADGATCATEFRELVNKIVAGRVDVVIGTRYSKEGSIVRKQPIRRRIGSRIFNFFVRVVFVLPYADTQCGAKVMRRSLFQGIQGQLKLTNYAFDVELLWRLRRIGANICEVGIAWEDKEGSHFRTLSSGWESVISLIRIRLGFISS